ncbi:hypothetical protein NFI95_16445, partial [Acetobacteraceae bacterium KSS8]|nr:hypothetical protein [Acetobacteraceae bacterium KSS8]
ARGRVRMPCRSCAGKAWIGGRSLIPARHFALPSGRNQLISIASWNAQGNPLEHGLGGAFLRHLVAEHDIVVLQSCGALVESSFAAFRSIAVDRLRCDARGFRQPISVDPFCSVAILSRIGSAFPFEGGAVLDSGRPGVFGVCCSVAGGPVLAAVHAAPAGLSAADWSWFEAELRHAASGTRPLLVAAELGPAWKPVLDVRTQDARGLAFPSPGRRHDSFLAIGLSLSGAIAAIDCGGASDHDAVSACFA